ncbi:unnamed protein product [Leptidea sinapis]|uniref:Uncharacterized protein n=1 Tax=Leptidea sinapis TaxID=189913 RepID=A0A5E4PRZ2_9NEOP|nr:unnamed protein product [Leptidea sinapis]
MQSMKGWRSTYRSQKQLKSGFELKGETIAGIFLVVAVRWMENTLIYSNHNTLEVISIFIKVTLVLFF